MNKDVVVTLLGHQIKKDDIVRLVGLVVFIVLTIGIVVALWPSLRLVFEPGGVNRLISDIQDKGALGVLMLLGLQLLQIIVAVIPGEVVQMAAGILYGPLWGTLIILLGCVVSSGIVYQLVHRLGAPFVHAMVPKKYLVKFYEFEHSGKLSLTVFILFLIPGMPKDAFTYIVPLFNLRMRTFLALTTIARIPGVIISTYAAAGLADGDIKTSLILFGIAAVLVVLGIVFRNRLFAMLHDKRDERAVKREYLAERELADGVASTSEAVGGQNPQQTGDASDDDHSKEA